MEGGIYSLTNVTNGKRYIGQTVNFKKRKIDHFSALRNGRHQNPHLQRAWDNGQRFRFEVIEPCEREMLNDREIYWIDKYNSMRDGYNLCAGGASALGRVCTEETRRKISRANKGRVCSAEEIARRRQTLKRHLEEDPEFARSYRQKRSSILKGRPAHNKGIPCPEWKKKLLSQKLKGRRVSEEHRERLRERYSGEKSLTAKLTRADVATIRLRYLNGERQADIKRDYDVTAATVCDIVRGRRWKSVPLEREALIELLKGEKKNGANC